MGLFRLLHLGVLSTGEWRFLDSLRHLAFSELAYNINNSEILAPWITLLTQEALLNLDLLIYIVAE